MSQLSAPGSAHAHPTGHAAGGHDDHGHHDPHLAHHFGSLGQQFSSAKLGMWLFLSTEILLFGGLFCAYAVYRGNHPEIFVAGAEATTWQLGAINTIVLILSSVTMAWGVTAAQKGQKNLLMVMLALTFLGGVGFMGIKYVEYSHKMHEGLYWAGMYDPVVHGEGEGEAHTEGGAGAEATAGGGMSTEGMTAPGSATGWDRTPKWDPYQDATVAIERSTIQPPPMGPSGVAPLHTDHAGEESHGFNPETAPKLTQVYFSIYYGMTGLHGLHVLIGMGIIGWLFLRARKNEFGPTYFTPVDLGGLYWHLVDLIWIFLFPLLYLV